MPSCYASYHHRTTSHRLITHPAKPRSISRLTQHFAKAEDTALSGSPRLDPIASFLIPSLYHATMHHLHAFMSIQQHS
ncbi:hypothetical protein GQ457_07G008470 [Hibiscus cannabinus]